jgi:aldose 1-epimerase
MDLPFHPLTVLAALVAIPALAAVSPSSQSRYRAAQDDDVVRLEDTGSRTVVTIVPSVGNMAVSMRVAGEEILRWPYASVEAFKAKPSFSGIPFMGPWANRLDEQAFYANGQRYAFDMELGNIRGAIPIHGFLTMTDRWQVTEVGSDATGAWLTSTLEFSRVPAWMKQFPFAHTIRMTYRLSGGVLEVRTRIENLSREPMPVSVGFHPYFQLTDSVREEWTLSVGARTHWLLAPNKIPTGETEPIAAFFPDPDKAALKDVNLDHVFSDLVRDDAGRAIVRITGRRQTIEVAMGPNYRAAVLYSPAPAAGTVRPPGDRGFICVEPMAGITNAMNLAHKGIYKELQSITPGGVWDERFWIKPSGF